MVDRPEAFINVNTNERPAIRGLKNLVNEWSLFTTGVNQGLELVSKALGGAGQAYRALSQFVGEAIELASVQEDAERRLAIALRNSGDASLQTLEAFKAFASELQQVTTVGDETTLVLQQQLLTMGVTVGRLKEATRGTIGLARAFNLNLNTAARLVARALDGDVAALRRYAPQVETAADATRFLAEQFDFATAEAETLQGRVAQLGGAWDDLKEQVGLVITENQSANSATQALTRAIETAGSTVRRFREEGGPSFVEILLGPISAIFAARDRIREINQEILLATSNPVFRQFRLQRRDEDARRGRPRRRPGGGAAPGVPEDEEFEIQVLPVQPAELEEIAMLLDATTVNVGRLSDSFGSMAGIGAESFKTVREAIEATDATNADFAANTAALAAQQQASQIQFAATLVQGVTSVVGAFQQSTEQGILALVGLAGQTIAAIGAQIVQLGIAAVSAGTVGTAVPFLAPLTGGPAGIAAGTAAIATGTTMIGVGTALSVGSGLASAFIGAGSRGASGAGAAVPSARVAAPGSGVSGLGLGSIDDGIQRLPDDPLRTGGQSITVIQQFGPGSIIGNDPRGARALGQVFAQRALPIGAG